MQRVMIWITLSILILSSALGTGDAASYEHVQLPGTIRAIVAYSAGGSTDALVRVSMAYFEEALRELTGSHVNTVVVNLPGAGGEVGFTAIAEGPADGSVIGVINLPSAPILEAARDVGFAPWLERFVPLAVNVFDPNFIMLHKDAPYATLAEAIEAARNRPGSVVVGADGPLSDDHLALYALEQATGAKFALIPYAGGGSANRAFLAHEVDINLGNTFDYISVESSVKEAATFGHQPQELAPHVPPVKELLGLELPELGSTRGFVAPAGVPEEIVEVYQEAFRIAFSNLEYQAAARERGITLVEPRIGSDWGKIMRDQHELVQTLLEYFVEGGYIERR